MQELLISVLSGEKRIAWLDKQGALQAYWVQRQAQGGSSAEDLYGARFVGRITRLDHSLGGAFVDIGLEQPGFLPFSGGKQAASTFVEGRYLPVRVVRTAKGSKGVKLRLLPDVTLAKRPAKPGLLAKGAEQHLRRLASAGQEEGLIRTNDPEELVSLQGLFAELSLSSWRCELDPTLVVFPEELESIIAGLSARQVPLPGGGHLLIEPVETLTAIDVNSGAQKLREKGEEASLAVNLSAVPEIVRQIRLRCLSGLIVIDFLPLADHTRRDRLMAAVKQAFADEMGELRLGRLSRSGLLELARQRLTPPLHEILARPGGDEGGFWQKKPETIAFEVLRQLHRLPPKSALKLRVHPDVAAALRGVAAQALDELTARRGWRFVLEENPGLLREELQIDD